MIRNRRAYFTDTEITNYISTLVTVPRRAAEGMLTETFACTELNRLYLEPIGKKKVWGDKPCFSICVNYELDFMVVGKEDEKAGIEIKTGNNRTRSLEYYKDKGFIDKGIRVSMATGGEGERFRTIPVYTVGCRFPYDL